MNYIKLNPFDTANGEGVRVSLFVSGCRRHCKGCFNRESWDFNEGKLFTNDTLVDLLDKLRSPYITGFSLLGGEPFEEENLETCENILKAVTREFPQKKKDIWVWSGFTLDEIKADFHKRSLLKYIDVLVDGEFILSQRQYGLRFRGSTNQQIHFLKR